MKEKAVTHFLIRPEKMEIIEAQTNLSLAKAQLLYVARHGDKPINFYDLKNLSNTKDISFWMRNGEKIEKLEIPARVTKGLIEFLKLQSQDKLDDIDCLAFANIVEGLPIPKRNETGQRIEYSSLDHWNIAEDQESKEPGDVFFFLRKIETKPMFTHAAIYIGNELYLSVYGLGGEAYVTELHDLVEAFHAEECLKMTPKKPRTDQ